MPEVTSTSSIRGDPPRRAARASPPSSSPSKGFKNTTVRDIADAAGHPVGQPLPPLRLQGVDGRRDPLDLPGRALRPVRRDPGQRRRRPGQAGAGGPGLLRGDRPAPARGGDLPERGRLPRRLRPVRLPGGAQRAVAQRLDDPARPRARSRARCAPTSTSSSPTASSATPCGSPCAGTAPAASSPTTTSPTSTCAILLDGISHGLTRPTSSTPSARRSASAGERWPRCTPPTWPRTR